MREWGRAELLTSPVFALSIVLLLVNDHVLKQAWPGFVTGKLSDVAGVAMIAILVIAAIRHVGSALALTALAFTLLKTVPVVAVWASPVLGGVTSNDPTDLVALLVLMPLGRWARSERRVGISTAWSLPIRIVTVSAAVFATTATSCAGEGVLRLAVVDGTVFADTSGTVFRSDDGGATWRNTERRAWDESLAFVGFGDAGSCVGNDTCLEISRPSGSGPASIVVAEVSVDDRTPLLVISDQELRALTELLRPTCEGVFPEDAAAVDRPDGAHVVVALGEAGVLHRPPDEPWEWVAVGDFGLPPDEAESKPFGFGVRSVAPGDPWAGWPFQLATAALLLVGPFVALGIVPVRRSALRSRRDPGTAVGLCVGLAFAMGLVGLAAVILTGFGDVHQPRVVAAMLVWAVAIAGVGGLMVWQSAPRPDVSWQPPDVSGRVD